MKPSSAVARRWQLRAPLNELQINRRGDVIAAALGDGSVALWPADDTADAPKIVQVHEGVSLCLIPDADDHAFLSGGDDGRLFLLDPALDYPTPLAEIDDALIEKVAATPSGVRAFSWGKKLRLLDPFGEAFGGDLSCPSPVTGLAFSPDGLSLAACHKEGVSLFSPQALDVPPTLLASNGALEDVFFSPDGAFLFSALREGALHGWRLADREELHMQGYQAPIRSARFTSDRAFLVTSGADRALCWSFDQGGSWNRKPLTLGGTDARLVTHVAPHPKEPMVAIGYDDGMIVLAPLDGRMEIMILAPAQPFADAIAGLVWNAFGDCLFAATNRQALLLFTLKSIRAFA